ncbi:AAA family ATPase [Vulcanisaeta distributa]|uniref:AAA family ATPase n=1 Tax=Vulcanisaeta distributa TaxID=164451 RepID=UPI000AF74900|nr:AAA family ATPase [Vulcanisaeta distributa]
MITRIEIENFRSIIRGGRAVITEGINFIHGPNGSGKTSILEAIAIAFTALSGLGGVGIGLVTS